MKIINLAIVVRLYFGFLSPCFHSSICLSIAFPVNNLYSSNALPISFMKCFSVSLSLLSAAFSFFQIPHLCIFIYEVMIQQKIF